MSENPTGDFYLVNDPHEAEGLLRDCLRTTAVATLWAEERAVKLRARFELRPTPNGGFSVTAMSGPEQASPAHFQHELAALNTDQVYFSVSLPKANIFFRTNYAGSKGYSLHFESPKKIYKVQRRKNMRFIIREGYLLKVSFSANGVDFVVPAYDISAGGLSVLCAPGDESRLPVGLNIPRVFFEIHGHPIVTACEIRHFRAIPNLNAIKAGLRFTSVDPKDAETIDDYVYAENTRFMARNM